MTPFRPTPRASIRKRRSPFWKKPTSCRQAPPCRSARSSRMPPPGNRSSSTYPARSTSINALHSHGNVAVSSRTLEYARPPKMGPAHSSHCAWRPAVFTAQASIPAPSRIFPQREVPSFIAILFPVMRRRRPASTTPSPSCYRCATSHRSYPGRRCCACCRCSAAPLPPPHPLPG